MKLIKAPNSWLEKTVAPFDFKTNDAIKIEEEMSAIMTENKGVGLAANQVELDAQIFMLTPVDLKGYKDDVPFAIINPKITHVTQDMIIGEEGCLSFPFLYIKIKRPAGVIVECFDSKQQEQTIELTGWNARIFGHEYDHLYGINFVDRVSKLKLNMAKKKRTKLLKKFKRDYPHG